MKAKAKEYELVIDYCAFMVSIVLARHAVTLDNINDQWSAEELAATLNILDYSDTPNLRVHSLALKHGMQLFTRSISKRGHTTVLMLHTDKAPSEYFTLEASARSTEVIFASLNSSLERESQDSLMSRVEIIRNDLMKKSNYGVSSHHTAGSVFAALYLPLITEIETVIVPDDDENKTPKSQLITRKPPSELSRRAIRNSANKIIANTENLYGKQYTNFYLASALKKSKKRKYEENELDEYDDESSDDDEIVESECEFMDDSRVLNALSSIPVKYVTFSDEDQDKVLSLYAVIRDVAVERDHIRPNKIAAKSTVKILQNHTHYSNISTRTIRRWYDLKDTNFKKTGRKIDEVFESEVWGNLMLCIFNKKNDEVNIYSIIHNTKYTTHTFSHCMYYVLTLSGY